MASISCWYGFDATQDEFELLHYGFQKYEGMNMSVEGGQPKNTQIPIIKLQNTSSVLFWSLIIASFILCASLCFSFFTQTTEKQRRNSLKSPRSRSGSDAFGRSPSSLSLSSTDSYESGGLPVSHGRTASWSSSQSFSSQVGGKIRSLSMQRFWTTDGNRKCALFLFNLPSHYHIFIAKSLFTCRDD